MRSFLFWPAHRPRLRPRHTRRFFRQSKLLPVPVLSLSPPSQHPTQHPASTSSPTQNARRRRQAQRPRVHPRLSPGCGRQRQRPRERQGPKAEAFRQGYVRPTPTVPLLLTPAPFLATPQPRTSPMSRANFSKSAPAPQALPAPSPIRSSNQASKRRSAPGSSRATASSATSAPSLTFYPARACPWTARTRRPPNLPPTVQAARPPRTVQNPPRATSALTTADPQLPNLAILFSLVPPLPLVLSQAMLVPRSPCL